MHDVSEVFGQIWFPGLLLKLWNILPASYFLFFKSYLNYRSFSTKVGNQISLIRKIWNFSSCYFSPIGYIIQHLHLWSTHNSPYLRSGLCWRQGNYIHPWKSLYCCFESTIPSWKYGHLVQQIQKSYKSFYLTELWLQINIIDFKFIICKILKFSFPSIIYLISEEWMAKTRVNYD